jgi:hypothetical protein
MSIIDNNNNAGAPTPARRPFGNLPGRLGGGASNNTGNGRTSDDDFVKAKTWVNFGYMIPAEKEGEEDVFIGLPKGTPLDTMVALQPARGENLNAIRTAQNKFMLDIQAAAAALEPGQDVIILGDENTGLCVQLRKVKEEASAAPVEGNRFVRTFNFTGIANS